MTQRVVLVDDADDIRRLVRTALRFRGGFDVVGEASNGMEAIEVVSATSPDLVVLDIGLPDLAGRDVVTRLRAACPTARIVVFSGYGSEDHAWIAQRVEEYVMKDDTLDYLVELLEAAPASTVSFVVLPLEAREESISTARRFLRETLTTWNLPELIADAQLVVSELVTNAIIHASSSPELRISLSRDLLRIEVFDDGDGTPDPQEASATAESGRGMHIVAGLSAAWGVEETATGKVVWAEMTAG